MKLGSILSDWVVVVVVVVISFGEVICHFKKYRNNTMRHVKNIGSIGFSLNFYLSVFSLQPINQSINQPIDRSQIVVFLMSYNLIISNWHGLVSLHEVCLDII